MWFFATCPKFKYVFHYLTFPQEYKNRSCLCIVIEVVYDVMKFKVHVWHEILVSICKTKLIWFLQQVIFDHKFKNPKICYKLVS